MKRVTIIAAAALVLAALPGCGSTASTSQSPEQTTSAAEPSNAGEHFTNANWSLLASDPDSHKGASVSFVGKVFVTPERDSKGVYLQVWADPQNSGQNTIVAYSDPSFQVNDADYVRVSGTARGSYTGKNAFGADLNATLVVADNVQVVGALAARPPAINTYGSATYTQSGVTVTVRKIEFAASETRVFVTVHNGSGAKASVYGTSMKAVQAGQQLDSTFSTADYPELSSDLVSGVATTGVVVFPKMNPNGNLKLYVDVNSDDYNVGDYGTLKYIFTWPGA